MDSSGLSVLDRIQHPIGMVTDFGCAGRDRVKTGEVFIQFEFQLAIVSILAGNHADVVGSGQIVRIGLSASNGKFLVQFHRRIRAKVTTEFQAIIEGSHFMRDLVIVFVDDTRHAILAVMTIRPVNSDSPVSALDGKAVSSILALQADAAILAVDDHGRAVFAVDADRTVNAILARRTRFAFFANGDTVALDVLVHLDGQAAIGIPYDLEVFSGIIRIRFRAFPSDGQFLAQVTVNGDVIVALEIQALCCHFLQLSHVNSVGPAATPVSWRVTVLSFPIAIALAVASQAAPWEFPFA